jgi:hypothetical protein
MTGRVASSRFVRIASLALLAASAVVVDSAAAVALLVALEDVAEVSVPAAALEAALEVAEATLAVVATAVVLLVALPSTPTLHQQRRTHSRTTLLPVVSPATLSTYATCPGRLATRTLLSSSPLSARSNAPRSSTSLTVALAELVSLSSRRLQMLRPLLVSFLTLRTYSVTNTLVAKFTGYQYGGRPLGLAYVKYSNLNNGDVMEGTEHTGGLTQDQIM